MLWGLAAAGSEGVQRVLDTYREELTHAMGLAGAPTIAGISRDLVA
ncbi:MAG: alpha-hydroxy-acid oxidizing protein [Candidatus Dormiibacterota bacterium]